MMLPSSTDYKTPPAVLRLLRAAPSFKGKARIARRLLTASAINQCALLNDRYGNRILVPNLAEPIAFSLGLNGSYESEAIDFIIGLMGKDDEFLDVGANIGAFTLPVARVARRVIAVEASPLVFPFLERNVSLNQLRNVTIHNCAASEPGKDSVPFYVPPMDHFGMGSSAPQFNVAPGAVPARTLDSLIRDREPGPIRVIKVDVEGFEAHVFMGAIELLQSSEPPLIVFEFCDWTEERAFPGRKGWAQQILMNQNYDLWPFPEFLHGSSRPLAEPLTAGCHTIVARRRRG